MEIKSTKKQVEVKNEKVKMKIDKTGIEVSKKDFDKFQTKDIPRPKYDWK